jgi:hypothetical protein
MMMLQFATDELTALNHPSQFHVYRRHQLSPPSLILIYLRPAGEGLSQLPRKRYWLTSWQQEHVFYFIRGNGRDADRDSWPGQVHGQKNRRSGRQALTLPVMSVQYVIHYLHCDVWNCS